MPTVSETAETAVYTGEHLVLDPSEVAEDRTELDLNLGPLRIRYEGPDWGDSEIANYMAELARGEIPVDYRIPNRKVTIPLMLGVGGYEFEEVRSALQAKVARIQEEGGWLKRELWNGRKLYLDIVGATLHYGGSTLQGFRQIDLDVSLVLEAIPDFYGDWITTDAVSEATLPELVFVLDNIEGNYPGRVRIVVYEDEGEAQMGLVWGIRSRHYSDATTARLAYGAEALTLLDAAATATISGASGEATDNVVRHDSLSTNWTPVLSTDVAGEGSLTHTGTYRVLARVYSTSSDVQLRQLWDVGDLALPVENKAQTVPGASNFYILDLGEIRLDAPPVGAHRWQGVIQAKGSVGGENIAIDRLWIVPVDDGYGRLTASLSAGQGLASFSARDEFNQTAGALTGKTLPVGGVWVGAGDADDFAVEATGKTAERVATSDSGVIGRTVTVDVNLAASVVQVDFKWSATGGIRSGVVARYVDSSNMLQLNFSTTTLALRKQIAGSYTTIVSLVNQSITAGQWYTLRALVDTEGRVFCWWFPRGAAPGAPLIVAQDSDLATGGTLASGDVGFADDNGLATAVTRNYDSFAAWVPTSDAVLFAGQSAELRTDGIVRGSGSVFGPVSQVIGDLPRLPPSGLEGRSAEVFVKASRGDLDLPDTGIDDIRAQVYYRPSWLFVPGA